MQIQCLSANLITSAIQDDCMIYCCSVLRGLHSDYKHKRAGTLSGPSRILCLRRLLFFYSGYHVCLFGLD